MDEKLCIECGRPFYAKDDLAYDKITGQYQIIPAKICPNCKKDLGIEEDEELEIGEVEDEI